MITLLGIFGSVFIHDHADVSCVWVASGFVDYEVHCVCRVGYVGVLSCKHLRAEAFVFGEVVSNVLTFFKASVFGDGLQVSVVTCLGSVELVGGGLNQLVWSGVIVRPYDEVCYLGEIGVDQGSYENVQFVIKCLALSRTGGGFRVVSNMFTSVDGCRCVYDGEYPWRVARLVVWQFWGWSYCLWCFVDGFRLIRCFGVRFEKIGHS